MESKTLPHTPSIFCWTGKVIHGEHVGRTLGFPSANLDHAPDDPSLQAGVYLCRVKVQEPAGTHFGLAYYGPRYVHGQRLNSLEVFIYDFDGLLYDQELQVELLTFVRPPIEFTTLDQVKDQLSKDKLTGLELLKTPQ